MSKFATILIKIIMIIAIVGVIVFVAFAIITNQNISFEAYNYISSNYETQDFDNFRTKVNSNMKSKYNGQVDTFAVYISRAIAEVNSGSQYFLNYLSTEDKLTKGEQDNLKNLYNNYILKFETAKETYDDYMASYADAHDKHEYDAAHSMVAESQVIKKCAYFVERYTDCYVAGSNFFKNLASLVNKYSLQSTSTYSYKQQTYLIKVGIVDGSTNYVYSKMKDRDGESVENFSNARDYDLIDCFYDFLSRENNFKEENLITNINFQNFVLNLNHLNIYEFAGNYLNYKNSLKNEETILKCEQAHNFFVSNFRG